jgi:hypothetical protein
MAPSGNCAASSPVLTPGDINQGTLAPGAADTAPMFVFIHSAHASNGAMADGVSEPRLGVLPSLI